MTRAPKTHDGPPQQAPVAVEAPSPEPIVAEVEVTDPAALAEAQSKADLLAEAASRGLPTDGTKADLAERIAADDLRPEREPFFGGWYAEDVPIYNCPHCALTFTTTTDVMWHIRRAHPDDERSE